MTYKKCVLCGCHIQTWGKYVPKDDTKYLCISCWKKIGGDEQALSEAFKMKEAKNG